MVETILYILYGVLTLILGAGCWRLWFAVKHFQLKPLSPDIANTQLPTVTVCIPARNEDHALHDCLERVIASDYEKLEIIVLDDLSVDDTPVVIKAFAHEGVRFVEGSALPEGWLGKNHALNELLQEASGTYVLFMDVDTRLEPDSIDKLVRYALQEKAAMVSVLPRRNDGWRASVMFSTLRYFWELMFHRKSSPATASNAWLIHRKTLVERWNGLVPFKSAIQPESKLSAALMAEGRYRFVMSSKELGIGYEKRWHSQVETSVRLLFPLLGSRVANTLIAFLDLLLVSTPLFIALSGFILGWGVHQAIAIGYWLLFATLYGLYLKMVWRKGWWLAAVLWPLIVLQEAFLLVLSAYKYSKKAVTWKGRVIRSSRF